MKRNIRTIIIVALLLIILIGVYFFIQNLKKNEEGTFPGQPTNQIEYLIEEEPDSIAYIQYNAGDVNFTVHSGETPTIEGYTSHIIDSAKLESALMGTAGLSFSQNMGAQDELSKYGLENEEKFVLFKLKNGEERKIIIGNPTRLDGEYYARKSGENVVYTLSSRSSALIMCHPDTFRDTTVCVIDNYTVDAFSVEKAGKQILEVKRDEKFAKNNGFIQSNYIIKYPYTNVEANNDTINSLFGSLTSVYATEIVEENPADLSLYGLDKANVVTVKDKNGSSTVRMGKYAEDGTTYVMRDDIPVVFKAVCPFYETVKNLVPEEYIARYIHIFNIKDVESVVVENSAESHVMKITQKSEDSYEYKIDDRIKAEDNFRTAYTSVISPIANKIAKETASGEEACKITFAFKNKTVKTFVYYKYDEYNYIVKADNGLACLVKKESIDDIFKALK